MSDAVAKALAWWNANNLRAEHGFPVLCVRLYT